VHGSYRSTVFLTRWALARMAPTALFSEILNSQNFGSHINKEFGKGEQHSMLTYRNTCYDIISIEFLKKIQKFRNVSSFLVPPFYLIIFLNFF